MGTQHLCRICSMPVCNLRCSVQDTKSDNEIHRVHGDPRCLSVEEYSCSDCSNVYETEEHLSIHIEVAHSMSMNNSLESEQSFECPTCSHKFSEPKGLQDHIEINHEQISSLSLVSDTSSNSWMHVTCKICGI